MKIKLMGDENTYITKSSGITLIALVVTIVVLLILAAISISLLGGENGIIIQAMNAKEKNIIAEEKEKVELAAIAARGKTNLGEIIEENLAEELTKNIGERDIDYTLEKDENNFIVTYIDTNRSYLVDPHGKVELDGTQEPGNQPDVPVDIPDISDEATFTRAYGVIEIEFLEGTSYTATSIPNEPNMTDDMKAVYWENNVEKVEGISSDFDKNKWYSYIAQTGATTSGGTSKWANAKTSDGSYWVWIPRYAYRIVYFDTQAHADAYRADNTQTTGIVGYSDARGIVDKDGKTPSDLETPVTSIGVGKNLLRPHPAFEDGSEIGYTQGEWDNKLEGIWIAKYEMSESGATVKSIPGVEANCLISIGTCYTKGYNYARNKESHLIKNSEWGAIAYFSESKYGRNGTALTKNNSYYTGGGSGATTISNKLQSTTGNEYGIFDLVGCFHEYIAGYIADSSNSNGNSFASTNNKTNNKTESTKYSTVYKMANTNSSIENYKINTNKIFGDATIEISTSGSGATSWGISNSYFFGNGGNCFLGRGGSYSGSHSGTFNFKNYAGESNYVSGFRVVLVVM